MLAVFCAGTFPVFDRLDLLFFAVVVWQTLFGLHWGGRNQCMHNFYFCSFDCFSPTHLHKLECLYPTVGFKALGKGRALFDPGKILSEFTLFYFLEYGLCSFSVLAERVFHNLRLNPLASAVGQPDCRIQMQIRQRIVFITGWQIHCQVFRQNTYLDLIMGKWYNHIILDVALSENMCFM